jgi:hypothetical protein
MPSKNLGKPALILASVLSTACVPPVHNLEINCPAGQKIAEGDLSAKVSVRFSISGAAQRVRACLSDIIESTEELEAWCQENGQQIDIVDKEGVHVWKCSPKEKKKY